MSSVEEILSVHLQTIIQEKLAKGTEENIKKIQKELAPYKALAKRAPLVIKTEKGETEVKGLRHKQLELLLRIATTRQAILLVGMAGVGKTHTAQQVAEAMSLPFYAISVGAQTSKSDIMGYMHAGGEYVRSMFREAYENGGIFLMDEIDAGNSNVLIQINSALSNNICAFPDKMVKKHDDFVFIASANTYGFGANRMYVGRNQLDSATLDRFTIIDFEIDIELENAMAGDTPEGTKWLQAVRTLRQYANSNRIQTLVTPRAVKRGIELLAIGIPEKEVKEIVLVNLFPEDKRNEVRRMI